jgi:hypothetical protein
LLNCANAIDFGNMDDHIDGAPAFLLHIVERYTTGTAQS